DVYDHGASSGSRAAAAASASRLRRTRSTPGSSRAASSAWTGPYPASRGARRSSTDRKSTRLNSSHVSISYAVFCLKKKRSQISKSAADPLEDLVTFHRADPPHSQVLNQSRYDRETTCKSLLILAQPPNRPSTLSMT